MMRKVGIGIVAVIIGAAIVRVYGVTVETMVIFVVAAFVLGLLAGRRRRRAY